MRAWFLPALAGVVLATSILEAPARAQPAPSPPPTDEASAPPRRFTRGQAVGLALTSAVFSLGTLGVDQLPGPTISGTPLNWYYGYATEALASAPLMAVNLRDAAGVGGLQLGLIGGTLASARAGAPAIYVASLDDFAFHQGLYATYATYRDARAAGLDNAWSTGRPWEPVSGDQMILAPLQARNLSRPLVWIPTTVAVGIGGVAATRFLLHSPIPSTAARDALLAAPTAWYAGVGEEGIFRGFIYEELQTSIGRWPARFVDMVLFTAAHVPGELATGDPAQYIAIGLATRAAFALLADMAYDQGGLRESIALHVLWDFALMELSALTGKTAFSANILPASATSSSTASGSPTAFVVTLAHGTF